MVPNFQLKIVHLEMINLVVAFRLWTKYWRYSSIHIYCDNEAVVQVVASSKTKDLFLAAFIHNLWLLKAIHDVDLHIFHINKGFHKNKADLLSRSIKTLLEVGYHFWRSRSTLNCEVDKDPYSDSDRTLTSALSEPSRPSCLQDPFH